MRLEDRLKAAREAAAPAPWVIADRENIHAAYAIREANDDRGHVVRAWQSHPRKGGNVDLIVAAVNSLPALEELLRAVRQEHQLADGEDSTGCPICAALVLCDSIP